MNGLTLDSSALIAFERNERRVVSLLRVALEAGLPLTVPSVVVAQVWRDGSKQVLLARFLGHSGLLIEPLHDVIARKAGQLCGVTKTKDIVDAAVVVSALGRKDKILTSDIEDLRRLSVSVQLIRV